MPTVLCSPVFVLFLFVFPVFCFSSTISFTRDELLNIRQKHTTNLLPDFDYSDALLDIIVGGAAVLFRRYRSRRRGKRASALVKLRQRGLERRCLASISRISALYPTKRTNFSCSPGNNKDFSKLCCSVFHGNLLKDTIPDQRITSSQLQLIRADREGRHNGEIAWRRDVLLHQ